MPKKTGRPLEDPPAVIQLMVNLLAAQPEIGDRGAAKKAAMRLGLKGQLKTQVERLRKRLARERAAGLLPAPESSVDRIRRTVREAFSDRDTTMAQLRAQLAAREAEAAVLGLDISALDLYPLVQSLESEKDRLEGFVHGSPAFTASKLINRGLSADEADAEILAKVERLEKVRRELEVVHAIWERRSVLGRDTGSRA